MSEMRFASRHHTISLRWLLATLGGPLILLCTGAVARADAPNGDPQGEKIAKQICSACHVVAKDQEFPPILDPPAPSFQEIANRPGMNAATIRRFVATTHWDTKTLPMRMPSPMLLDRQIDAVAKYLLSLRTP